MVGVPGDAKEEDIKKQMEREVHGALGSAGGGPVTLTAEQAAYVRTLLGEPPKPEVREGGKEGDPQAGQLGGGEPQPPPKRGTPEALQQETARTPADNIAARAAQSVQAKPEDKKNDDDDDDDEPATSRRVTSHPPSKRK